MKRGINEDTQMHTRVIGAETLDALERHVASLKVLGWKVSGEGVPFWANGMHCLEIKLHDGLDEAHETHWIPGFTGEVHPSLNELSDLHEP